MSGFLVVKMIFCNYKNLHHNLSQGLESRIRIKGQGQGLAGRKVRIKEPFIIFSSMAFAFIGSIVYVLFWFCQGAGGLVSGNKRNDQNQKSSQPIFNEAVKNICL